MDAKDPATFVLNGNRLAGGRRSIGGFDQFEGLEVVAPGGRRLRAAVQAVDPMLLGIDDALLDQGPDGVSPGWRGRGNVAILSPAITRATSVA